jgi:hypothetical protein
MSLSETVLVIIKWQALASRRRTTYACGGSPKACLNEREKCAGLRCATALRSLVWMVRCRFLSMKARTRMICQPAKAPGLEPRAPEWRSISDRRMVDAVASDAFAASRSRSSSRLAVSRSLARLLAKYWNCKPTVDDESGTVSRSPCISRPRLLSHRTIMEGARATFGASIRKMCALRARGRPLWPSHVFSRVEHVLSVRQHMRHLPWRVADNHGAS